MLLTFLMTSIKVWWDQTSPLSEMMQSYYFASYITANIIVIKNATLLNIIDNIFNLGDTEVVGHSLTTFQNNELCLYERKICHNVSFATVRFINHSWDRIKCLASCFIKNIFFLRLLLQWGGNICLYRHNTLNAHFLTFSSA